MKLIKKPSVTARTIDTTSLAHITGGENSRERGTAEADRHGPAGGGSTPEEIRQRLN